MSWPRARDPNSGPSETLVSLPSDGFWRLSSCLQQPGRRLSGSTKVSENKFDMNSGFGSRVVRGDDRVLSNSSSDQLAAVVPAENVHRGAPPRSAEEPEGPLALERSLCNWRFCCWLCGSREYCCGARDETRDHCRAQPTFHFLYHRTFNAFSSSPCAI